MNEHAQETTGANHVCPVSHAGWLASSLRKLLHNPSAILKGLVREGDTALDLGCGPGFFTLPLARLVGESGRVVAVDLQKEMLEMLRVRAARAGLLQRIRPHLCAADVIGYPGPADFVLAFYMVHEVPDIARFMAEVRGLLRPGGRLLMVEPWFHVSARQYRETLAITTQAGLRAIAQPRITLSQATLFERV
jgi:ubiquinone/menaquinone biosynthesis C-methylase UbiE